MFCTPSEARKRYQIMDYSIQIPVAYQKALTGFSFGTRAFFKKKIVTNQNK